MLGLKLKTRNDVDVRDLNYSTVFKLNRQASRVVLDVDEILNQGSFGTCTAFATSYSTMRIFKERLSELFNYAKTKEIDSFKNDEGSTIDWTMKAYRQFGSVPEKKYPYSKYKEKLVFPSITKKLADEALKNRIDAYVKITSPEELTDHLLHGQIAIGGFTVGLTSLFNPEHLPNGDAVLDMPLGTWVGHALAIIGIDWNMRYTYKDGTTRTGFVKVANSWGTEPNVREFGDGDLISWAQTGCGWIPFDYVFGKMYAPDGSLTPYVNEIFVPLKDIHFTLEKIDPGNADIKPFISNGRTMIPLRFTGEALGADVMYQESDQGITIRKAGKTVKLNINQSRMYINNVPLELDQVPIIKESRTFVPLRAVAEAFECTVKYFESERRVLVRDENVVVELWLDVNEARKIVM